MKHKILIVEDEVKVASFIKIGLEENQYDVDVAYDGELGEHFFTTRQYSMAIFDIIIPEVNVPCSAHHYITPRRNFSNHQGRKSDLFS